MRLAGEYESPEEAQRVSHTCTAYGIIGDVIIVYTRGMDPYLATRGNPGIPIRKATAKEIDNVRRWSV